jgi:hypothetical protein
VREIESERYMPLFVEVNMVSWWHRCFGLFADPVAKIISVMKRGESY